MLGILLIDKPTGITSHDVVNVLRRRFATKRVGHAGTLDPLATGLLVAAIGPATRFLQYLSLEPKEYVAEVRFGEATNTQDSDGAVVSTGDVPADLASAIERGKHSLEGSIQQVPPMFSAVKRDGKPLYAYARQGIELERRPRTVYIETFEVLDTGERSATIRIVCSGGTYVRTLAHDLGAILGCGAHLTALRRTRVGIFVLERAVSLDAADASHLIPLPEALNPMAIVSLDDSECADIREGRRVGKEVAGKGSFVGMIDASGAIVGVAEQQDGWLQPECVIPISHSS